MTGRWRLLAWAAALALGLWGLHALGAGPLGVPLDSLQELATWIDRTPPEAMALALVRLAALAGGWYLAGCTLVLAIVRPFGRPHLVAAVSRMAPTFVCRVVCGGGSIGVALGTLLGGLPSTIPATMLGPSPAAAASAAPVQARGGPGATATMTRTDDPPTATMTRTDDHPPTATMTRTDDHPPTATMTRRPAGARAGVAAPASPTPPAPSPGHSSIPVDPAADSPWIVEAGDSFWSIAAETVSGSESGDAEGRRVIGYWRRLIEANRSRLLDPANPDLLLPGQELVLPDPRR